MEQTLLPAKVRETTKLFDVEALLSFLIVKIHEVVV